MKVLGIDYGRVRVGVAVAEESLAVPLMTIEWAGDKEKLVRLLREIVEKEGAVRVVIGISEGVMAKETEEIAEMLAVKLDIPVTRVDETLTTVEARRKLAEGNKSTARRGKIIDAAAAAVILQYWLDQGSLVK